MRTVGLFVALAVLATAGCATLPPCPAHGESSEEFRRFGDEPDLAVPIELRIARPD
jgi:hypothetical protein